ncbi:MAG: hypothetical protein INR62_07445 [Rhodospirillales bacterium]|nr:hypothetical protein [Acetobacter sp.]
MHLPPPRFEHSEEIYKAIVREHRGDPTRMGEVLMACGWKMVDAARAIVQWDLRDLAAAIANERSKRKVPLTSLSEDQVVELKKQILAEKNAPLAQPAKKTTRIVRALRTNVRSPQKPPPPNPDSRDNP